MRRFFALTLVAVFLAACGSGSSGGGGGASSSEGQKYVDAAMKSYKASSSAGRAFTKSQAECVASGLVDKVGVDTLKSAGVTPSDFAQSGGPFKALGSKLSRKQAVGVVSVITDGKCFNFADLVTKSASSGSGTFAKLTKAKVRCLFATLLADKSFKNAMVDSMLGKASSSAAFQKAFGNQSRIFRIMSDCKISPNELGTGN